VKPARSDASLAYVSLHTDPPATAPSGDNSHRTAAKERIEDGSSRGEAKKLSDYRMWRTIPEALSRQHREGKSPAKRGVWRQTPRPGFLET